jgi:2,4-dichlorophenol 6-monooxygenase
MASPCKMSDLPQQLMEPILVKDASLHGVIVRLNIEFVSFEQTSEKVDTILRDRVTKQDYTVTSKYLVGADGAKSKIVAQLGLPLDIQPQTQMALNLICEIDLSKRMDNREGSLHWVLPP